MKKRNRMIAFGMAALLLFGQAGAITGKAEWNDSDYKIIGQVRDIQDTENTEAMRLVDSLVDPSVVPSMEETVDEETGIRHAGIVVSKEQLDTMRDMVREKKEPWLTAFQEFTVCHLPGNTAGSSLNPRVHWGPDFENVTRENGLFVATRAQWDGDTAFRQMIMWYITGNITYRKNAIDIVRKYARMQSAVEHSDCQIRWSIAVTKLCAAAEMIKYTSCDSDEWNWNDEDEKNFLHMLELTEQYYNRFWHWMNQHTFCTLATMSAAIFKNDLELYQIAVERATVNSLGDNGGRNGSIKQQIREISRDLLTGEYYDKPNIQVVEMGRDMGHAYCSVGGLGQLAQIITNQGTKVDPVDGTASFAPDAVDVFDFLDQRLLKGANYICKYNLGYEVPFAPCTTNNEGTEYYSQINDYGGRGRLDVGLGVIYYYYKYVKKVDMDSEDARYLARAYEYNYPELDSLEFTGSASLLYAPADAAEQPVSKYVSFANTPTRSEVENASAVLKGEAEIRTEGDTVYVRTDATNGGTCLAIRDGAVSFSPIVAMRVRSNGNATVSYTCLKPDRKSFGEFKIENTLTDSNGNSDWAIVSSDFTGQDGISDSTLIYLTIQGDATRVDLDYLSYLDGIPTTSIEETDTQKIVHYAVRDLVESYNPGYKAEFDEEKQIPDVIQMAGWNSGVSYQLPTNNSSHLTGVSVNVRGYYTDAKNGRKNKLALFYQKDGTDTIAGLDRLIQNSAYPDYADVVLMETTNPAEFSDIDRLYLRWGPNAYGSVFIRDITMTYEKSEADRALDAVVAAARDVRDPSDELTDVLAQAQQLKFSTTSDMNTAIGATQQEIEEIAARLDRLAGRKGASIETVDEDRAVLREKTLTFESGVTAGSVKAAVTATDPADAELQVYTDRTMTEPVADGAYITSGNVVAVQAEGYSYNLYTILLQSEKEIPVTEAEETADKKIVRFAAADLSQIYGNVEGGNITVVFDQKYNVENVIDIGAWGSFNKFYLPSEHIQDIRSISINARGAGTAAGRSNPITVCGEDQEGIEHPAGFSLPLNETEQGEYAEHQMTNYMLQDNLGDAEKIYLRWGQAWGNCYIKTVTVTYEKTDSERELDHAIAEAEKLADRNDDIEEALAEAKQYKVSLADDVFAALAATEEQIQEVTQRLDALVESVNRKGDLTHDGKIMTDDALYALELASGKRMGSAEEIELGDMNGDGVMTAVDALLIIKSALS